MGKSYKYIGLVVILLAVELSSCGDKERVDPDPGIQKPDTTEKDTTTLGYGPIDFTRFKDSYAEISSPDYAYQWRHYNVHDPAIIDDGTYFYSYSTDVAYGHEVRSGLQIRRSLNMVEWEFVGWVFNTLPPEGAAFIRQNGAEPFNSLWAPYTIKVGEEYRLYYSLTGPIGRLSVIGLATATKPQGPFIEKGIAVSSKADNSRQTNAIDPTVVIDESGRHWMYYGSAWDGIYLLELDPASGLALVPNDKGRRVAQRGFTGGWVNGNIEGPEVIYHPEFDKYYLFIAYDWLETKYNVRVGRSDSPEGPFYDIHGVDMNEERDDAPMLLAPYRFQGHSGWQGVSHVGVVERDGNYYLGHQGRPGSDKYFMILHTRQIHWTADGWPLVSPQRYAGEEETEVTVDELAGTWEQIVFGYTVVPGYAEEQVNPDFQHSVSIALDVTGTINGDDANTWQYEAPWLTLSWAGGTYVDQLYVERGRDWENEVAATILFTGLNQDYTTIWGKKIDRQ